MKTVTLDAATSKMIGFLLAICGNTLIACSLTMQKSAHNSIAQARDAQRADDNQDDPEFQPEGAFVGDADPQGPPPVASGLSFLKNPTWWIGTALMATGEVGNFAAFAFAPTSLVAPLGAWSVVLTSILAHVFLREDISCRNFVGIVLCVVGAFLIGIAGPDIAKTEAQLDARRVVDLLFRPPFMFFILCVLTATAILIFLSHRTSLGQRYVFVYVGVSSLLGAVTVVCAKALSTFLKLTIIGNSQFGQWPPFVLAFVLAAAILAQLRYLNLAMAKFGNAEVCPVYYVLFTICAMTSGVIMYNEFESISARNLPFFFGLAATMSGVYLVSRGAGLSREGSSTLQRVPSGSKRHFDAGYDVVNTNPPKMSNENLQWP